MERGGGGVNRNTGLRGMTNLATYNMTVFSGGNERRRQSYTYMFMHGGIGHFTWS